MENRVNETLAERMLALNERLVQEHIRNLAHDNPRVRRKAVRGLGSLGGVAAVAVPALETLLKDPDRKVRQAAEAALAAIGQEI